MNNHGYCRNKNHIYVTRPDDLIANIHESGHAKQDLHLYYLHMNIYDIYGYKCINVCTNWWNITY
jgi:hypothetical protein